MGQNIEKKKKRRVGQVTREQLQKRSRTASRPLGRFEYKVRGKEKGKKGEDRRGDRRGRRVNGSGRRGGSETEEKKLGIRR